MNSKAKQLTDEYIPLRETYRLFSIAVSDILKKMLGETDISIYQVTCREKDPKKLREKVARKQKQGVEYEGLSDIEDLAGVRIIPYLESQKDDIAKLILNEFEAADPKFEDKSKPNGYKAIHVILHLDPERLKLPEYKLFEGLKCEIQITSALYHTWSEIEHDIIYKPGADKSKLKSLGLDEIEKALQDLMANHIEQASIHFDHIYKKHQALLAAKSVFFSDFIVEVKSSGTNEELISIIDIAEQFSHKKPKECVDMMEAIVKRKKIDAKVIGEIGDEKIYGKSNEDVLVRAIDVVSGYQVRYSNVQKVLELLYDLSKSESKQIGSRAVQGVGEVSEYHVLFLEQVKSIFPQFEALKFIKNIPAARRKNDFEFISTVLKNILSVSIDTTYFSSSTEMKHRSGALNPGRNLVRLRKEGFNFCFELLKQLRDPKQRLEIIRILTSSIYTPGSVVPEESLIQMLIHDTEFVVQKLRSVLFNNRGKVKDYVLAIELEQELSRLLKSKESSTTAVIDFYNDLERDNNYQTFCVLVGETRKFISPDEDWNSAEKRRESEMDELISDIDIANVSGWQKKLSSFAKPLKDETVESWQYAAYKTFIQKLVISKPKVSKALFELAVKEGSSLSMAEFVTPFLSALRQNKNTKVWDSFVQMITKSKRQDLFSSIVYSLNFPNEQPLDDIRSKDVLTLTRIVRGGSPFGVIPSENDNFRLRHALIGTLSRIYRKTPNKIEKLIVEEISSHPDMRHVYFHDLPFSGHRDWMHLSEWTKKGRDFISNELVDLPNLDWHTQEMLVEMHKPSLAPILDIFLKRIKKGQKRKRGDSRYETVPHHINPELQKYISEHDEYTDLMERWMKKMTPKWSKYNWDVSQFIKSIGGTSYKTILMSLIKKSDHKSLLKASYALQGVDEPDFDICMEIVKRTDDKRILNSIAGRMCTTGVVSGEDGMARAFEAKAKSLEKYLRFRNNRIKKFARKMIEDFKNRSEREHSNAKRRTKMRKLDFGEDN